MKLLTPELALVDRALGSAARAELPQPPDVFTVLARHRSGERPLPLRMRARDDVQLSNTAVGSRPTVERIAAFGVAAAVVVGCTLAAALIAIAASSGDDPAIHDRPATPHAS